MDWLIFGLPGNENLATQLSEQLQIPCGAATIRHFPDGESYVRILSDVRDKSLFLVMTLNQPDDKLFEALIRLMFADRGLHVPTEALRFMTERLNREYWTAERAVEEVDRFAISERARVTLPTVRRALSEARMIGDAA